MRIPDEGRWSRLRSLPRRRLLPAVVFPLPFLDLALAVFQPFAMKTGYTLKMDPSKTGLLGRASPLRPLMAGYGMPLVNHVSRD
jgi:hypothetical protein